jgi:hypothetical protein
MRAALRKVGVRACNNDPGGVAITLENGHMFRVTGECNACDEKKILVEVHPHAAQEARRPGFKAIIAELQKDHPHWPMELLEARSKELWHIRNPAGVPK